MKNKWTMIVGIALVVLIGGLLAGPIMSDVEQPKYDVVQTDGNIEIRTYGSQLIAQVSIEGARKEAIGAGFQMLADYIFGNNTVSEKIAMTAPVEQQASTKIAMTAPVQQTQSGDSWVVSFIMPSEYTVETLPKPNNAAVKILTTAPEKMIVIRFAGETGDENIKVHQDKLEAYIAAQGLSVTGTPRYAFYNPPWTLPALRRNEIMIKLSPEHQNDLKNRLE